MRYWLFYVRHVLENDAMRSSMMGQQPGTAVEFRKMIQPVLKYAPSRTQGSQPKAKRLRRDMLAILRFYHCVLLSGIYPWTVKRCERGLGVFATRRTRPGDKERRKTFC